MSKRSGLAVLTPAELALKAPAPPDDSCAQHAQHVLSELADSKIVRDSTPLSADEIAIYQTVLANWNQGSRTALNVSAKTTPLNPDISDCECLNGMDVEALARATHTSRVLTREILIERARLVSATRQASVIERNDPLRSMARGNPVDSAVDQGFASGLFELSEIAFDKKYQRAIVSYSFVCGSLCGNGGVWLFEKVDGRWKQSERDCGGGWVS